MTVVPVSSSYDKLVAMINWLIARCGHQSPETWYYHIPPIWSEFPGDVTPGDIYVEYSFVDPQDAMLFKLTCL